MLVGLWVIHTGRRLSPPSPSLYQGVMSLGEACRACRAGILTSADRGWYYEARPVGPEPMYDVVSYMVGHTSPVCRLRRNIPLAAALAFAAEERARDAAGAVAHEWRTVVRAAR